MFIPDNGKAYKVYEQKNAIQKDSNLGHYFISSEKFQELKGFEVLPNDIIVSCAGTIGETYIMPSNIRSGIINQALMIIRLHNINITPFYLLYFDFILKNEAGKDGKGTAIKNIPPFDILKNYLIPLPPLEEQDRIIKEVAIWLRLVDFIDGSNEDIFKLSKNIKLKILDLAIQGKLVSQDPNDEPAIELLKRINPNFTPCDNSHYENIPFKIPQNWCWIKLNTVCNIARGGSPRPIKDYLTTSEDGINWIKIGDTDKDGKYINSTKEKIIPDGVRKSRMVHKGDFLLTNSMSFGRPYILNVDGCIHDGWLVISPMKDTYDTEFLYYLLSSRFAYDQFTEIASGGVVSNLNSDKVANSYFPILSISEQKRIADKITQIWSMIDTITAEL